jgi:hypothetical protein
VSVAEWSFYGVTCYELKTITMTVEKIRKLEAAPSGANPAYLVTPIEMIPG